MDLIFKSWKWIDRGGLPVKGPLLKQAKIFVEAVETLDVAKAMIEKKEIETFNRKNGRK